MVSMCCSFLVGECFSAKYRFRTLSAFPTSSVVHSVGTYRLPSRMTQLARSVSFPFLISALSSEVESRSLASTRHSFLIKLILARVV
jgi:hypothetical protein